jgi:hypothetical protein
MNNPSTTQTTDDTRNTHIRTHQNFTRAMNEKYAQNPEKLNLSNKSLKINHLRMNNKEIMIKK